jgi:hypothetical protein
VSITPVPVSDTCPESEAVEESIEPVAESVVPVPESFIPPEEEPEEEEDSPPSEPPGDPPLLELHAGTAQMLTSTTPAANSERRVESIVPSR